eukprot:gene12897-3649_t
MAYPNAFAAHPFQQQPLPPGWEAKYEPTYFINHVTKETSWIDPRTRVQQQPAATQQAFHQAGPSHLQPSPQPQRQHQPQVQYGQPSPQPPRQQQQFQQPAQPTSQPARHQQQESIAMQNLGQHRSQESQQQATSFSEGAASGKTAAEKQADTLLEAALQAVDYNENLSRELLRSMGYKTILEEQSSSSSGRAGESSGTTNAGPEDSSSTPRYVEMQNTDFGAMYSTAATTEEEEDITEDNVVDENVLDDTQDLEELNDASSSEVSRPTTAVTVSRDDVHISVDSPLGGLLTEDAEANFNLDTNTSAITSSSRSAALENLLSTKNDQPALKQNTSMSTSVAQTSAESYAKGSLVLASGRNKLLVKGPDTKLRKKNEVTLNGPDSRLARGHDKDLLSHSRVNRISSRVAAQGPNPSLCRGQDRGLALGPVAKVTAV